MTLSLSAHTKLETEMQSLKSKGVPFAMATVVRTVDATSAKPGSRALLDLDGNILMGWVGGGCARGAVGKAAREAIKTGEPQFISLRPQELLKSEGVVAGELRDGVRFTRNGCPSKGTMDVFVEPVLPLPEMVICGTGLVAMALAELATRFDFKVSPHAATNQTEKSDMEQGFGFETANFVVVATQGQGDSDALRAAVSGTFRYVCFVGSRQKFDAIASKLVAENPELSVNLKKVKAPAGLSINAITPDEIALSILAEITQLRRAGALSRETADV
jgi:xanthine dehydrogenase accessory factor